MHKAQYRMKVQKVRLMNILWRLIITCTDQRDDYSSSESGDSESDEDCTDDRIGFHMVMSTRAGRERVFTSRMRDFLQSR